MSDESPTVTVLLVDDDAFNREGVRLFLARAGFQILEAGDEQSAWEIARRAPLGAAVIDISIPPNAASPSRVQHNFGIQLTQRLKHQYPQLGIVLFSAYEDRGSEVLDMVRDGVRGLAYILKGCTPQALLSALQDVLMGRVLIDAEVTNPRSVADELRVHLSPEERPWVEVVIARFHLLSQREREVIYRLAASQTIEGIALTLKAAPRTIEHHISSAYGKLGLHDLPSHLHRVIILTKACMIIDLSSSE